MTVEQLFQLLGQLYAENIGLRGRVAQLEAALKTTLPIHQATPEEAAEIAVKTGLPVTAP